MRTSTITAKIKPTKAFEAWFIEQSKKAAELYNACLNLQMENISSGKKELSSYDLANEFRFFNLGSDFKDKIFSRIAESTSKWLKSEKYRYQLYWQHQEIKNHSQDENLNQNITNYPYLQSVSKHILQRLQYTEHIKRLARKQIIFGRPRKRKKCSLAFSVRPNRQNTVQIKLNKVEVVVPKYKEKISAKYNFLPTTSDYKIKLITLKKDHCGTMWFKITYDETIKMPSVEIKKENIFVGIDMGLKTTRTVVSVHAQSKEIVEIYQPSRVRYFDKAYQALVWASNKDKRALAFVHRKIATRRLDNINKDIQKILTMGEVFKFGKPGTAFLFSGRLAKSAADAANSIFLTRFAKRAELAGKKWGEVNESYTSVTCRKCLARKSMPLKERIYLCNCCGHEEDRDINSAYQIAWREFRQEKILNPEKQSKKIRTEKNSQLSGCEMKSKEEFSLKDFQAQAALQALTFMSRCGRAD